MGNLPQSSRRELLALIGAGAATVALPRLVRAQARHFFERHHLPLGAQIYSVADLARQDMAGTLRKLAAAGYQETELAGYLGHTPSEIRRLHDEAGLRCTSAHIKVESGSAEEPGFGGDLDVLAQQMHVMGISYVIVPSFPLPPDVKLTQEPNEGYAFYARVSRSITLDHWKARAEKLNKFGEALRAKGLKAGYHNHGSDFTPIGSQSGIEILLSETEPKLVTFELDVGWAFAADQNPVQVLRDHPGRFHLIHLKDMQEKYVAGPAVPRSTEIGSGLIDWHSVLEAAYSSGARKFFVEQEPPFTKPPLEAMALSAKYLRQVEL